MSKPVQYLARRIFNKGFDGVFYPHICINQVDTKKGFVECTMPTMHGNSTAFLTTLVDEITGISCFAYNLGVFDFKNLFGVSISFDMAIKNREKLSGQVRITSEITDKSDNLINCDCKIYDLESGELLASGTHVKYLQHKKIATYKR